mmetsp:Transcript_42981/g.66978  ORF Transcript_42981/g.66978 Transcript_42981/m.66978 type:complete len:437 (+) Transcript_42981:138-1448(+)
MADEEVAKIKEAIATKDSVALTAAITRAEKAGADKEEIAAAKRAVFQLQKEKREQKKKAKEVDEVAKALEAAVAGNDVEVLRSALQRAESTGSTGSSDIDMTAAQKRLASLEEAKKKSVIELAMNDFEYAIASNDIENATLALEEAGAEGADPEDIEVMEKKLAALREQLDPEAEQRRRRLEARKGKSAEKKWNFSGKTSNPLVNDRFREHEEELEKRRMLAFRGRGKFRGDAEDEGDEAQEKVIRKERADKNKEAGYVPPPPRAVPKQGFQYLPPAKEELEAPRKLKLQSHLEMGAGIDLHACWWGMLVDGIDEQPGQPGLRVRDTIIDVNGTSLRELEEEDAEQRFADLFGDGSVVTVVPYVEAVGVLHSEAVVDRDSLKADLERFSQDWGVELKFEEISSGGQSLRIIVEGPQTAVKACKSELESLMKFYAGV